MKLAKHPIRVLFVCLLFAYIANGGGQTTVKAETEARVVDTIDLTGIMRNSNGNSIMKKKYVTRAEFAQMLVQSSANAGRIKESKTAKLFQDVKPDSDEAAYIQAAVAKGYMSGYLKGKFKPKQAVTLKEAAYATLATLGYTTQDFNNGLSGSRIEKFRELGLDKNISKSETDKLTEMDCINLFYNLLNAKSKSGAIHATTLGYSVNNEGKIDYQALLEKTTSGPVLAVEGWKKQLRKELSSYKILYGNTKIIANNVDANNVLYIAEQSNKIWLYDSKKFGLLENVTYVNGKPQEVTVAGKSYLVEKPEAFKDVMDEKGIKKGSMVTLLLGRDDKVAHLLPMLSRVAGGDWMGLVGFDVRTGTLYKNGVVISSTEVKSTDVLYYVKELKTIWVYGKTVYGVLNIVTPSASLPDKVTIAGISYNLDAMPVNSFTSSVEGLNDMTENMWGKRLRENGIQEGDNVMVSFGYDGKVVDINKVSKMSVSLIGYVVDISEKLVKSENKENSVKRMIHVAETSGTILDLECSDLKIDKGSIVEIHFVNGRTEITKVEAYSTNNIKNLPLKEFAEGVRIIEVKDYNYIKLSAPRTKSLKWSEGNALYARVNSSDEITDLILSNVSDSFYQYGLLKKVETPDYEKGLFGFRLTLDMGEETTLSPGTITGDINPGPKALRFEGNTLKEIKSLQRVRLRYISGKQANSGEEVYRIDDNVLVFFFQNGEYFKTTFDSLPLDGSYNIDGYMESGKGPIHIILVTK